MMEGKEIQLCFCAGNGEALPAEPLDAHDLGCLVLDWAAAHGKISPGERLRQLVAHSEDLGLSAEEIENA